MVGGQHRPLGMTTDQAQVAVEDRLDLHPDARKAVSHVGGESVLWKRMQLDRLSLAVQRSLAVGEQLPEQRGLRAGEDVACGLPVMLNATAHQAVEPLTQRKQILKLIEDDKRPRTGASEDADGEIEQLR